MNDIALADLIKQHGKASRDALIPILQDVQQADGYISRDALVQIGRHLDLPTSKVYGVATFYNQFRFQPPGRFRIQVCRGTACHVKASAAVLEALERELDIEPGQTTRDGLFSLEVVACLGVCGLSPVITVGEEIYARVTPDSIRTILSDYRRKAEEYAHVD